MGINDLHARNCLGIGAEGPGAIHHQRNAFQREGYILRGEVRSIVKPHTAAEREFPSIVAHRLPGFRQGTYQPRLGIRFQQIVENHGSIGVIGRDIMEMWIGRGDLRPHPHAQILRRGRHGSNKGGKQQALHGGASSAQ